MMTTLYHATQYDKMRLITNLIEADSDFDEVNGFIGGKVFCFEGCVFLSEEPLELNCVGGTYHVSVYVPADVDLESYRYTDDDDYYGCKNYAIPAGILNTWSIERYDK